MQKVIYKNAPIAFQKKNYLDANDLVMGVAKRPMYYAEGCLHLR